MMASPALRGRARQIANPYPTAALRDVYRKQACSYRGSGACLYCQAKDRNGGICPSATFLGMDGGRRV